MDASLNLDLITGALGADQTLHAAVEAHLLPTPEQLQDLLAQAEVALFIGNDELDDALVPTAWFLHGVASADASLDLYDVAQQRQAFAVSAHIFDLACNDTAAEEHLRLQWAFAAQVGFHRSEGEPNASAIGRRVARWTQGDLAPFSERLTTLALRAGIATLTLDAGTAARALTGWNREIRTFEQQLRTDDAGATIFGPTVLVVRACHDLLGYLRQGDPALLERARTALLRAVSAEHEGHDHVARWVAAHLRSIGDSVARGSVWSVLPSNVPDPAKQAFTMTAPHVLTLWQPQRELLAPPDGIRPPGESRRLVLSVPTSAGKTLIGQLLMVEHIAVAGTGVCYVAPQRGLGREVRRGLTRRLRLLAREMSRLTPDAGLPRTGTLADLLRITRMSVEELLSLVGGTDKDEADIAVMTPERLAHALREDADAVLNRYGMFVFDEAHQIRERSRGFLFESVISFLHWRTRQTHHRIVLLSAVMGNAGQIRSWIDPDDQGRLLESTWRGPRRLSVLFGVDEDHGAPPRIEAIAAKGKLAAYTQRRVYPVHGTFRLKPTGRKEVRLKTRAPLGQVSIRTTPAGVRRSEPEASPHSTPKYRMLAQMVSFLGHAGAVLVICDNRKSARNMAQAVAATLGPDERARGLALTARIKLGDDHPLAVALDHGVGYHHAGLPSDLLESLEDAVRHGQLQYLVATSTLTEGVNLPVRTVVLSPAHYDGQPEDQKMTGPKLVNAIGRAGRAVLESEGWVVMTHYGRASDSDFEQLEPTSQDLTTRSVLTHDSALEELEKFEAELAAGRDAAMAAQGCVADFQSFVWFALSATNGGFPALTASPADPTSALGELDDLLDSTLAFAQLPAETRAAFERVAERTSQLYASSDPIARRAWARMGTSIDSARKLDDLSKAIADHILQNNGGDLSSAQAVLDLFDELGVWGSFLELPESPRDWKFAQSDHWRAASVNVDPHLVLSYWLTGARIPVIADAAFAKVTNRSWRLEVAVDTTSDFCEHYFAWLSAVLITRVNERLFETGCTDMLCEELGTYIRYGVSSDLAVELLTAGIRSRELASAIAEASRADGIEPAQIRDWLGGLSFTTWQQRFAATELDLVDLIEYARPRSSSLLRDLLLDGKASIDLNGIKEFAAERATVALARDVTGTWPFPIGIYHSAPQSTLVSGGGSPDLIGYLPPRHHAEAELVLDAGLEVSYLLSESRLLIALVNDDL